MSPNTIEASEPPPDSPIFTSTVPPRDISLNSCHSDPL